MVVFPWEGIYASVKTGFQQCPKAIRDMNKNIIQYNNKIHEIHNKHNTRNKHTIQY